MTKDVPPYEVRGGNPAKNIRYRFEDEIVDFLLELEWWDWNKEKIKKNAEFLETNIKGKELSEIKSLIE